MEESTCCSELQIGDSVLRFYADYVHELSWSVSGWERNSPKILGLIILLDKLNGVRGNSVPCDHLRNNPRGDLRYHACSSLRR
jgi:hypothetical protein